MAQFEQYNTLNMQFQSTSTMLGSGSLYTSTPSLNTDGTACYNAPVYGAAPGRGLKKGSGGGISIDFPTIPENPSDEALVPLGDGLIPLLLMAFAFMGIKRLFKKQRSIR